MNKKVWRWIAILAVIVTLLVALRLIGPAVPNEIQMLTGPAGTTFFEDGLRYKEILARHGVTVHVKETSGSTENWANMIEAEVPTAAFVWGVQDPADRKMPAPKGVESLGSMYLQPLWVFASKDADLNRIKDLSGSRVEAGQRGSDARLLALFLLREEAVSDDVEFAHDHAITPDQAVLALQNNQVAAMIAVGEPDSLLIDTLLRSPRLQVLSIRRAEAFAIKHRFLKPVRFPEGAHDLRANIPDHDLKLLAARAQLVVSDPFPPAVADLLLQAAAEIHGGATPFSARREFPNPETAALPLNRAADNYYTNGPSKLQKFLPYRLASLLNRFFMALVAMASAAVALLKILPALIGLSFKLSMRRSYSELERIERLAAEGTDKKKLLDDLAALDQSTAVIKVPLRSLETVWFELRQYIHDMRDRLEARQETQA